MPLKAGDAFLMSGTGGAGNPVAAHLMVCIVIDRLNDRVTVVPITTRQAYSDLACCLSAGEHVFIKHDSVASYEFARSLSIQQIENELTSGQIKPKPPVSADLLKRLQVGLVTSDEVTPYIYGQANGLQLTVYLKGKGYL